MCRWLSLRPLAVGDAELVAGCERRGLEALARVVDGPQECQSVSQPLAVALAALVALSRRRRAGLLNLRDCGFDATIELVGDAGQTPAQFVLVERVHRDDLRVVWVTAGKG